MKYILIVALLVLTITARSVHMGKEDPLTRCMARKCRPQASACAKTKGCAENIQSCADALQSNEDLDKFDTCLQTVPTSYALMECIFENCADVQRESTVFEQILKKMN
ncbi:unnamed protein product (macronuclear) [Paramecium tetraurelia]|uniref:Uncharacterized protein n=1 Tax=Paramecium tetraurelia TaxID=5888 RepID=A0CB31_PARTE|nr:uncharacterized protein GSPATT00036781001 [Paramecium tetraurelia]CAK67998.1 unnamed protein product [Paramecium tetraurelia]|eukprot:XP_001435395.1 hypothetical protein (macronuclear) [Paramecium tetraurelia strain d4-2]